MWWLFVLVSKHLVATITHLDKTVFEGNCKWCLFCHQSCRGASGGKEYCSLAHADPAVGKLAGCFWVSSVWGPAKAFILCRINNSSHLLRNPVVSAFPLGHFLSCVVAWLGDCCIHCLHGLPLYNRVDSSEERCQGSTTLDHSNGVLTEETWHMIFALWPIVMQRPVVSRKQSYSIEEWDSRFSFEEGYALYLLQHEPDENCMACNVISKGCQKMQNGYPVPEGVSVTWLWGWFGGFGGPCIISQLNLRKNQWTAL